MTRARKLLQIAQAQLKVGTLGFGGPLATMAFMRDELVDRFHLITDDEYLEGLAVVKLLPGPVSTLLSIFLGQRIAGWVGGVLGGLCYIFPAFLMLFGIAAVHDAIPREFFASRGYVDVMAGVQVAVLSVVAFTCWKLFSDAAGRKYGGRERKTVATAFAGLAAAGALARFPELAILLLCALVGWLSLSVLERRERSLRVEPLTLFMAFFMAGLTVFGTGYMVLPHIQRVVVEEHGWIDVRTFLDAVAWGNLTPGPIVIASTYMGYAISGWKGALIATAGIFGGPFVLMLTLGPVFRKFLGKPWVEGVLLGLIPAVAATIAVGLVSLGRGIAWGPWDVGMLALTCVLAFRKWPVLRIFGVAAVLGFVRSRI